MDNPTEKLITEQQEFEQQAGKADWYGRDVYTQSKPMIDPGTGKEVIIRKFEFGLNPLYKGNKPNKQDIFNMHWRQLRNILWGDGLVPMESVPPRVEFRDNNVYWIFLTCEARLNTVIADKVQTLQDLRKNK